jgi:hypothetical protein
MKRLLEEVKLKKVSERTSEKERTSERKDETKASFGRYVAGIILALA